MFNWMLGQAQENKKFNFKPNLVYAHAGLGDGQFSLGINAINSKNWGLAVGYNSMTKKAKVLEPNEGKSCFLGGDCSPNDYIKSLALRPSYTFPTNVRFLRLGVELGPSFNKSEIAYKVNQENNLGIKSWDLKYNHNYSVGLSFSTKIEFPVSRYFGMQVACVGNANKYRSYLAVEFHAIFGIVRDKKLKK